MDKKLKHTKKIGVFHNIKTQIYVIIYINYIHISEMFKIKLAHKLKKLQK